MFSIPYIFGFCLVYVSSLISLYSIYFIISSLISQACYSVQMSELRLAELERNQVNIFNNSLKHQRAFWHPVFQPSFELVNQDSYGYPHGNWDQWCEMFNQCWNAILADPYRAIDAYYDLLEELFFSIPSTSLIDKLTIDQWRVVLGYSMAGVLSWEDYKKVYCQINPEYLIEFEKTFLYHDKCFPTKLLYQMSEFEQRLYEKTVTRLKSESKGKTFTQMWVDFKKRNEQKFKND
uniref:Uncharacterized protein n=1 Tax=Pseudobryopsis hainanensis TaxID=2320808 RepID=A0A3S5WZY3_9CHLO|nr:hypothetical protein [Pseudobryopsis hainanensis]